MGSALQRRILLACVSFFSLALTWIIVSSLSELKNSLHPDIAFHRIALALAGYFFAILVGWFSYRFLGGGIFALFASVMVFFAGTVISSPVFIWFLIEYAGLCLFLFRSDQFYEDQIAGITVDLEKYQNEKNDLEVTHKAKGEGISILFEKYSTYYNLRKLAEELATTLSVTQLGQIIANRTAELVARAELALIYKVDLTDQSISLLSYKPAARKSDPGDLNQYQRGDLFDLWVVKNQRRLIVNDVHQDFRFDIKKTSAFKNLRSVILAPLQHERRVIGTLRLNSSKPEAFTNDDLRLLDTIAVLASSAISNATLYEQTEELAIKDSLTNLYVRRYFFDRLKEEHRRSLLTQRPLSVLMCDLDHFKDCNDRYGHAIGDLMLIQFSSILTQTADQALVARYGGEEFAVLLPEASKAQAVVLGNKIREAVEKKPFEIRRERIAMTVSIGVASMPDDALDLESLIQKSDQALYQAKRQGRNQVCSSGA